MTKLTEFKIPNPTKCIHHPICQYRDDAMCPCECGYFEELSLRFITPPQSPEKEVCSKTEQPPQTEKSCEHNNVENYMMTQICPDCKQTVYMVAVEQPRTEPTPPQHEKSCDEYECEFCRVNKVLPVRNRDQWHWQCPSCDSTYSKYEYPKHRTDKPKEINLIGEFDARKWAQEFMRLFRRHGAIWIDEGLMISWFANAIMSGYDNANWKRDKDKPKEKLFIGDCCKTCKRKYPCPYSHNLGNVCVQYKPKDDYKTLIDEARGYYKSFDSDWWSTYSEILKDKYELAMTAAEKKIKELEEDKKELQSAVDHNIEVANIRGDAVFKLKEGIRSVLSVVKYRGNMLLICAEINKLEELIKDK